MSQSTLAGLQDTGTTDALTTTTPDTEIVVDAATTGLRLDSWELFNAVAELTQDSLEAHA